METYVKQKLIQFGVKRGDVVGAAVSGGIDSMALLFALCNLREEMNIIIMAFHMEHGIRGERSVEDMRFVQRECEKLGVDCIVSQADVPGIAKSKGLSLETAAREARYAFLDAQKAAYIATAHHADDLAETVIMNLCRGSGLAGLCGIPEIRGRYIRPLLDVTREMIEGYVRQNGIDYVCDDTNTDTAYTRNYVRAEIIPRLKAVNEQAQSHIAKTVRLLAEDEDALKDAAQRAGGIEWEQDGVSIDIATLTAQPPAIQKRMVRLAMQKCFGLRDIELVHINDVLSLAQKSISGKRIELGRGLTATVVYGKLRIGKNKIKKYNNILIDFFGVGRYLFKKMAVTCDIYEGSLKFAPGVEYFDMEAINGSCFRGRQEGDYIYPLGMTQKKRLSDYLSDKKVPLQQRDALMLMAKGSEIFWVVGVGVSERSKVNNNNRCYRFYYGELE